MSSKLLNKKNTKPTRHILASKKQGIVVTVRACTPNKHDFLYKFSNFQPLICSSSFVCKATRLNNVVLKAQRKFFNKKKRKSILKSDLRGSSEFHCWDRN